MSEFANEVRDLSVAELTLDELDGVFGAMMNQPVVTPKVLRWTYTEAVPGVPTNEPPNWGGMPDPGNPSLPPPWH